MDTKQKKTIDDISKGHATDNCFFKLLSDLREIVNMSIDNGMEYEKDNVNYAACSSFFNTQNVRPICNKYDFKVVFSAFSIGGKPQTSKQKTVSGCKNLFQGYHSMKIH